MRTSALHRFSYTHSLVVCLPTELPVIINFDELVVFGPKILPSKKDDTLLPYVQAVGVNPIDPGGTGERSVHAHAFIQTTDAHVARRM